MRVSRSLPATGRYRAWSILAILAFVGYVTWVNARTWASGIQFLTVFFGIFALITLGYLVAALRWRSFAHLPKAPGKVLALIPAYEESSESVKQVVLSLLHQSVVPDLIYVIDDGSSTPIEGFKHSRVVWLRQENQGKRHAQVNALRRHSADEFDFILTVDSDSVLDPDALAHLLRSMSWRGRKGKQVMAATGMIFTRNWDENLITRLTDINIVSACLLFSSFFSWMGIQTPTSGAIALYRSHVVYDNIGPYLASGEVGDDRWLSFYSLKIGQVVRVNEAIAETALPATFMGTMKQRMRWSKSAYLGLPFVAVNFNAWINFFYGYPILFQTVWPLSVTVLTMFWINTGIPVLLYGTAYLWVTSVVMGVVYAAYRPEFRGRDRLVQALLSLLYPLYGLLLLRTSSFWALLTLRDQSWATRGASKKAKATKTALPEMAGETPDALALVRPEP